MSFEVGRLSAALTLEGVSEFHSQLDGVGRRFQEAGQKGSAFGQAGAAAFRTAAGATTGLVTAAGAYLAILTKTGVAYNSMQQNSRAALRVLLGGAEAANEQMGKLDDFARNSPFSKAVFIQAQQQLLGFGMEAKRVIPTLDSVQQAVAAMGGSNEQISEVVNILANVQSTGKITAETLNQLGYRGIDAATLMGDAMGKTAAQMREDISDGAIGGAEAIDILVDAMQNRFGGAADGVKENWDGAVDRIKAASRDLGSHIAEPFVSAEGGGMAVDWANQVANVLRAIEKQAVPVMGILTDRSMPFFANLTQGLDSAQQSIQRWDASSLEVSLDKLANHAPGIAAVAGAVLAVGTQVGPLAQVFKVLGLSANPVLAAFVGLAAASPEVRSALGELLSAGKPLLPVLGEIATLLSGSLNSALPLVAGGIDLLVAVLTPLVKAFADIPAPVLIGVAAFLAMHRAAGPLEGSIRAVATGIQNLAARGGVTAISAAADGVGALGYAAGVTRGSVLRLGDALKAAFLSNPIGIALTVVASAVAVWANANAAAQQKVEEHKNRVADLKGTLDQTTGSLTEASREMVAQSASSEEIAATFKSAGVSQQSFVSGLMDGSNAAKVFRNDLVASAAATAEQEGNAGKAKEAAEMLGVSYETLVAHSLGYKSATAEVNAALDETGGNWASMNMRVTGATDTLKLSIGPHMDLVAAYREQRAAIKEAQAEAERHRDAMRQEAAAMSDAARSNARFNDALSVARDTTADAESRVRALKQALDELKGGAISAEEAQMKLSETNLNLAEGLAQTDESGKKLWQSTLDGAGAIDESSRAGLSFMQTMQGSRDAMLDAARAASDKALADGDVEGAMAAAAEAGEGYISTLRTTMEEAGLTKGQIDGLIGSYLDVPDVVATLLTDNGTIDEVDQRALALALQLDGIPPGKSIRVQDPGNPEVIQRLRDAGYAVERIPGSKDIKVTQTGASEVENVLNNLARTREALINVKVTGSGAQGIAGAVRSRNEQAGGLYSGGVKQFAAGGMPSGMYQGVNGGIWKPGADGTLHNFAELHLGVPWEAYISGKPEFRERNIGLLFEAAHKLGAIDRLQALAFRSIPANQVYGTRAFARGDLLANRTSVATAPAPAQSVQVRRRRRSSAPLAENLYVGVDAKSEDLKKLEVAIKRREREG
ncbi:tape measure protein [Leucobacter sp. GX24907]